MSINTGNGASAVFSASAITSNFTSIDIGDQVMPEVNTSHLGTADFDTFIPGDLADAGTVTFEVQIDAEETQVAIGGVETLTITLPLGEGESTAATWAGSGFITSYKPSNFANNELQMGTIVFRWDGITPPTFTAAGTT